MWKTATALALALAGIGCANDAVTPDLQAGVALASSAYGVGHAAADAVREYEVTIENLTSSQPLSPGVVVTHTRDADVFTAGEPASEGIRLIAENGDPSTAFGMLDGAAGIGDVVATTAPVFIGGTLTTEIEARANANRFTLAIMLICTNDGFVGLDGVRLPAGFEPATYYTGSYDAGTEANDELFTSIVDACGAVGPVAVAADGMNARTATDGVIMHHPGIAGTGDLDPAVYGWTDPVARVTVQRVR